MREYQATAPAPGQQRPLFPAMLHGLRQRCPNCGIGALSYRYLKICAHCPHCGEALHHHRADDAPPYFTIMITGHIIVPLILGLEKYAAPPLWEHMAIWLPLTLILSLTLLPLTKGALVGLQWALRMHGFAQTAPPPAAVLNLPGDAAADG